MLIDETGKNYGRLFVLKRAKNYTSPSGGQLAQWLCKCDCGNESIIIGSSLRNGRTTSCGCYHAERTSEANRLTEGEAAFNRLLSKYKYQAKQHNREWKLTRDEFRELTKQDCFYCGAEPSQWKTEKSYNGFYVYNGIDRVDSNEGYIPSNVLSCCKNCNWAKRDRNLEEYVTWLRQSYWHIMSNLEN